MGPIEPKRRVKSIKKPGENPVPKKKKSKEKHYTRAYVSKMLKKLLKRRANIHDSVRLIYKTYRNLVKMACEMMIRDDRKITMKMARIAMAKLIPHEVAMTVIRELHQEAEKARASKKAARRHQ